jgi:hypothetical protein
MSLTLHAKLSQRLLLAGGLISVVAIIAYAVRQQDPVFRVFVPAGAVVMGGFAASFPWLAYALHGARRSEDDATFFVFSIKLFTWVGVVAWIFSAPTMFALDHDGGEALMASSAAICLAISGAKVLRRRRADPDRRRTTRGI